MSAEMTAKEAAALAKLNLLSKEITLMLANVQGVVSHDLEDFPLAGQVTIEAIVRALVGHARMLASFGVRNIGEAYIQEAVAGAFATPVCIFERGIDGDWGEPQRLN